MIKTDLQGTHTAHRHSTQLLIFLVLVAKLALYMSSIGGASPQSVCLSSIIGKYGEARTYYISVGHIFWIHSTPLNCQQ